MASEKSHTWWRPLGSTLFERCTIAGAGLLLVTVAVLFVFYFEAHRDALRAERDRFLEREISLAVRDIEARLAALTTALTAIGERVADGVPLGTLHPYMSRVSRGLQDLRTIIVVDADGHITDDLQTAQPRSGIDVSDRAFFRHHKLQGWQGLFVGEPLSSRLDGTVAVPISLAVRSGDGDLIAVVVGALDHRFFPQLQADAGLEVFLAHDAGGVLGVSLNGDGLPPTVEELLEERPGADILVSRTLVVDQLPRRPGAPATERLPLRAMFVGPVDWRLKPANETLTLGCAAFGMIAALVILLAVVIVRHSRYLRQSQAELDRVSQALLEAERLTRTGTWRWDVGSETVTWSRSTMEIFGREIPDPEAQSFEVPRGSYADSIHPDDRQRALRRLQDAFEGEGSYRDRVRALRWDTGEEIVVESVGYVETDDRGEPIRLYGITRDVTDELRVLEQLQDARHAAEAATKAREDFIAMVSHEIRTPMNAILGFVSLLVSPPPRMTLSKQQRVDYADGIQRAANVILGLVDQVLDLSRLRSGEIAEERSRTEVAGLVERALSIARAEADLRSVRLEVAVPEGLVVVCAPTMVERALLNIINNAVKVSRTGQRVRIEAKAGDGMISVAVADEGPGISPEDIRRLAEPFVRLESPYAAGTPGVGLGLAITRNIVEQHGGRLTFESVVGEGTTVRIVMPATGASDPAATVADAAAATDQAAPGT